MHAEEDRDAAAWPFASLLLGAQLIVSLVAVFLVWFHGMSSSGCDSQCDYGLWYWSAVALIAFAAIAFVASAAAVLIWRRAAYIWVAPTVGAVAVTIAASIAYWLGSIAFGV